MNSYFDYAASTPVSPIVLDAMEPWQNCCFANASSAHSEADKVKQAIKKAREIIANKIGAMPTESPATMLHCRGLT